MNSSSKQAPNSGDMDTDAEGWLFVHPWRKFFACGSARAKVLSFAALPIAYLIAILSVDGQRLSPEASYGDLEYAFSRSKIVTILSKLSGRQLMALAYRSVCVTKRPRCDRVVAVRIDDDQIGDLTDPVWLLFLEFGTTKLRDPSCHTSVQPFCCLCLCLLGRQP